VGAAPGGVVPPAICYTAGGALFSCPRAPPPPPPPAVPTDSGPRPEIRSEVAEGLRYVLGHPYLRYIAASTGLSNLFTSIAFATFAIFTYRILGLTAFTVGVIGGVGSIGILVGALVAGRIAARVGVGRTILWAMILSGPATLLAAFAEPEDAIAILVASGFLTSFAGVTFNINQVSLRQAITPERIQGRMNATMRFLIWGTIPIGQIVGGILASTPLGARGALVVGGVLSCFAFVPIMISTVPALRMIPTATEASTEGPLDADAQMASPGSSLD